MRRALVADGGFDDDGRPGGQRGVDAAAQRHRYEPLGAEADQLLGLGGDDGCAQPEVGQHHDATVGGAHGVQLAHEPTEAPEADAAAQPFGQAALEADQRPGGRRDLREAAAAPAVGEHLGGGHDGLVAGACPGRAGSSPVAPPQLGRGHRRRARRPGSADGGAGADHQRRLGRVGGDDGPARSLPADGRDEHARGDDEDAQADGQDAAACRPPGGRRAAPATGTWPSWTARRRGRGWPDRPSTGRRPDRRTSRRASVRARGARP